MIDGKQRRQAELVWTLEIDGHRVRCRPEGGGYVVELKVCGSSWLYVTQGANPHQLLKKLVGSALVVGRIQTRTPP